MTSDALNRNTNIAYDHRNLILELMHTKYILNDSLILLTKYYYDEAGNRIRKMTYDTEDDSLKSDIIYSRDVSGRELALYENNSIKQWNLFGLDNIGYMTGSDELRFYIKDHLGSVRVVTDNQSALINCQYYDQWGYVLENRNYQSDESVYKFTSKERDEESEYDYFGARYYDSRIGRWGQVEPLLDKYPSLTPYNYSVDNPLRVIDPNGADPFEIIVRTYIPFDVVFPGFKGDSRGADPKSNSFRTEQRITVETDRSVSSTIITNYDAKISPSTLYLPTSPVPTILTGIGEGEFHALAGYSSELNGGNNASIELTGEAHVGVIPTTFSPAIDYTFGITILPQKDGSVQVLLTGSHDKFPAYEIYVKEKSGNVTPIYNQSPVDPVRGPFNLFPFNESQIVNSQILIP